MATCYDYALDCHSVYLAIPGTCPLFVRKQNCLCIQTQSPKVKFIFVQINMNQVSYVTFKDVTNTPVLSNMLRAQARDKEVYGVAADDHGILRIITSDQLKAA